MKKNIKYILIIISLFVFQFVHALEISYPNIFGYEITNKSEFVDYVSYAFAFLISIGGVILVAVIIMAGIDFILAGGDSSKVSQAKKRIKDGFIGLTILLFSYLILNTINPAILGIENPDLEKCVGGGIILTIEKIDEKPKKMCIWETQSRLNIDGEINPDLTEWVFEKGQLKEVWAFDDYDFKGSSTMLFQDNEYLDDKPLDPATMPLIPKEMKSIFILRKSPGLYLYDKTNWGVEKYPPLFVGLQNFSSMNSVSLYYNYPVDYSDRTCSLRFVKDKNNPEMIYGAVLFEDVNYSGKCLLAGQKIIGVLWQGSMGEITKRSLVGNSPLTDYLQNNTISSVITYRAMENNDYGKIVLYNKSNCIPEDSVKDKCDVSLSTSEGSIVKAGQNPLNDPASVYPCQSFEGEVKSVSIEGKAGFVIRANNNYCMYFDADRNKGSNCINLENTKVFYESGYNPDTGESIKIRPKEIMVFPLEK